MPHPYSTSTALFIFHSADRRSLVIQRLLHTTPTATAMSLHNQLQQVITATPLPKVAITTTTHVAIAITPPTTRITPSQNGTLTLTPTITLQLKPPPPPPPQQQQQLPTSQHTTSEPPKLKLTPRTQPSPTTPEPRSRHSWRHTSLQLVSSSGAKNWMGAGR
jgi:hypothetical protein